MKLNNRGFTLIELLATIFVLGILMAMVIPNIIGISNQNKLTTYAEDAKRLKNSVEYMLRSDSTFVKPGSDECVVVNLKYVNGFDTDFDNPPYGGNYNVGASYVVMLKENKRYKYYVQLIENLPNAEGMRGIKLNESTKLDGDGYLDNDVFWEDTNLSAGMKLEISGSGTLNSSSSNYIISNTGCSNIKKVYFAN